jgi:hypothetical protein
VKCRVSTSHALQRNLLTEDGLFTYTMKKILFAILLFATSLQSQSFETDLVLEVANDSFVPKTILGLTRVDFHIINNAAQIKKINTATTPFVEIKLSDSQEWKPVDPVYNLNHPMGIGFTEAIYPNDSIFFSIEFDVFGYIKSLFYINNDVVNHPVKLDLRLVTYSNDLSAKAYSAVYKFTCPPISPLDKPAFDYIIEKGKSPFYWTSPHYLEANRLEDSEKDLLMDVIEMFPASTFATIAQLSLASLKSYQLRTPDNKAAIHHLLAAPLQSPYDHIRLLAGELLQRVNQ